MSSTAFSKSFQSVDTRRVDGLRSAIAAIESRLGTLTSVENAPADPALKRISQQMQQVMGEVAELKAGATQPSQPSLDAVLQHLQGGTGDTAIRNDTRQDALAQHLERLGESLACVENAASHSKKPQESVVSQKLNTILQTVDDLPETLAISRLEERLDHVNGKIEQLARAADASVVAQHRMMQKTSSDNDLAQVEARLAEIARAVIAISAGQVNSDNSVAIDFSGIERIEARVSELARTVDRIADVQDGGLDFSHADVRGLEAKLASLSARLDREVMQGSENEHLSQLETQIAALAGRVEQRPVLALDAVEEQLRQLALSVEQLAAAQAGSQQTEGLDERLNEVIDAVHCSQIGVNSSKIDGFLSKMEGRFAQTSSALAVEAAQAAAERVLAARNGDETLQVLADDLKKLRALAENDTAQTDRITEALYALAKRLESMERSTQQGAANIPADTIADISDPVGETLARADHFREAAIHEEALVEEANTKIGLGNAYNENMASEGPTAEELENVFRDEVLLEPGMVPEDFVPSPSEPIHEPQQDAAFDIRPDAIAAARKALQASTAEVAALGRQERVNAPIKSKGGKTKRASYQRPVLVAAAAVLLALSTYQGYRIVGAKEVREAASATASARPIVVKRSSAKAPVGSVAETKTKAAAKPKSNIPIAQIVEVPKAGGVAKKLVLADPKASTDTIVTGAINHETYDIPASIGTATFVAAASAGDPRALYELGVRYSNGEGVEKDLKEAVRWLKRSAELGFAPAQYSYGSMLQRSAGVEKDIPAAATWYLKAAQQGNVRAMHNYATILAGSARPNVREDMQRAVNWFKKAADLGLKDSQFNLGIINEKGIGVPKNLPKAYKWFSIAATTGDAAATKKRDMVRAKMNAEELSAARGELAAWKPTDLIADANSISVPEAWRGAAKPAVKLDQTQVKEVQSILQRKGYLAVAPDGVMGKKTVDAILKFQRSAGLPVTGIVDERVMRALRA